MHRSLIAAAALAVAAAGATGGAAQAQTAPSRAVPQDRIDQKAATAPDTAPPPPTTRPTAPEIAPFTLAEVRLSGSSLPAGDLEAAWRPFIGQTLRRADLQRLTDAVAALYARRDVALYTVLVPEQDFAGGVLYLVVVEGYITDVHLNGLTDRWRARPEGHARALVADRPLPRSTLEREVSQLREIPGLNPQIELKPGAQQGAVEMVVEARPRPVQFGLSVNNRGTAYLGRTQVQADLYLNSLMRSGDQARLSIAAPTDGDFFRYYGVSYSQILGRGTTVAVDATWLNTRPRGTALRGEATALSLQVIHPLIRGYQRNLYLTAGFDGLDSDNALLGQTITSDRIRAARGGMAWSLADERSFLAVNGSLSLGIDGLGARATVPDYGRLDFAKVNLRGAYNRALGERWVVRTIASAQWSFDRLPGSEQFALGGDEFGRAFEAARLVGDDGWAVSAALAWRPPVPAGFVNEVEVYGFVDGGEVRRRARPLIAGDRQSLSSAGLGVRASVARRVSIQLEAARGLDRPDGPGLRGDWRGVFSVSSAF